MVSATAPCIVNVGRTAKLVLAAAMAVSAVGCVGKIPSYKQASHIEGARLYNAGDYAGAAGAYRNAVKYEASDYKAWYYLGASHDAMKSHQQAIHAYRQSLQVMDLTWKGQADRDFRPRVIDALGASIARSDQRQVELDLVERQVAAKPSAEGHFLLAKVYRYSGDADTALERYNRAILLEPSNFPIVKDYALYLEQLGQTQRAEAALRRAYALNENDAEVNEAMRRVGVVPGPSLRPQSALARPLIPQNIPSPSVSAPRD